jgi:hypothetical protein
MKQILFLALTSLTLNAANAQTAYFSTSYTQDCNWNANTSKYEDCQGTDQSTMFTLNGEKTMFHHTTQNISSAYYVTSFKHDSEYDVDEYDVKSDAGNTYVFFVDTKNNQIRIVGNNNSSGNKTYMKVYSIKKTWTE